MLTFAAAFRRDHSILRKLYKSYYFCASASQVRKWKISAYSIQHLPHKVANFWNIIKYKIKFLSPPNIFITPMLGVKIEYNGPPFLVPPQ